MKVRISPKKAFLYFIICLALIAVGFGVYMASGLKMKDSREIAVIETTKGNIEIELDRKSAPITVDNFVKYVQDGYYSGTVFHRVIPGFMVQGGGFTAEGARKQARDQIRLESKNGLKNSRGTVAMARTADPDSATSQFFVNVVDNDFLDYTAENDGYAVFGRVISGMDVADQIAAVPTTTKHGMKDWPAEDVTIVRAHMK